MTAYPDIDWQRAPARPVALVLLPFGEGGTTICMQDRDGTVHGCRDTAAGPSHDDCVASWVDKARADGLAVEDRRGSVLQPAPDLWQASAMASGRGHVAMLRHDGVIILMEEFRRSVDAIGRAMEWGDQARAGLIPAIPARERLRQLANLPIRVAAAQTLDTTALPLFGDAQRQRELF